jgi:hypothetical protein
MAAKVTVQPDEVSLRRFMEATAELGRLSGRDFRDVIRHELTAMLNSSIRNTKKATVAGIRKTLKKQKATQIKINYQGIQSRKGRKYSAQAQAKAEAKAAKRRNGGSLVYMLEASGYRHRHPNWVFQRIIARRQKRLEERTAARGLTAKMFVHVANALKLQVSAPVYVRNAKNIRKGDMKEMVQATESGTGRQYAIGFTNSLTDANIGAGAARAFSMAMTARANFLSKSMKLAADGKIKGVLQRYPGLATLT